MTDHIGDVMSQMFRIKVKSTQGFMGNFRQSATETCVIPNTINMEIEQVACPSS